jgi:hypothetical protein
MQIDVKTQVEKISTSTTNANHIGKMAISLNKKA